MGKSIIIDFTDVTGGLNTVADPMLLEKNQVQNGTINCILTNKGTQRRPGYLGIKSTAVFEKPLRALDIYEQEGGTEKLLAVTSEGIIYEVNQGTGALTAKATMTVDEEDPFKEAWIRTYKNKAWIFCTNGSKKIENETAYRIGILAPASGTATAEAAASTLAGGVYKMFACYYRKVSGVIVLYSQGVALSDVTLTMDQGIAVSVPVSTDPQVSGMALFMTSADGAVYTQWQTTDTSAGGYYAFTVVNDTYRNQFIDYTVVALDNNVPKNFSFIEFADNRLWGVDPFDKTKVWYSLKSGTVYDIERWPSTNYIDFQYEVTALFTIGYNLYINTIAGVYQLLNADPSVKPVLVDKRWWFSAPRTLRFWGNYAIGLTNDGVRVMNGNEFSADLTKNVKNLITPLLSATAGHLPSACITRRDLRAEYHLSYMDTTVDDTCHNRRLVLNLDTLSLAGEQTMACWELWSQGAEYMAVKADWSVYHGQSTAASTIYKETTGTSKDNYLYDNTGSFITTAASQYLNRTTRVAVQSMNSRNQYKCMRMLARIAQSVSMTLDTRDNYTKVTTVKYANIVANSPTAGTIFLAFTDADKKFIVGQKITLTGQSTVDGYATNGILISGTYYVKSVTTTGIYLKDNSGEAWDVNMHISTSATYAKPVGWVSGPIDGIILGQPSTAALDGVTIPCRFHGGQISTATASYYVFSGGAIKNSVSVEPFSASLPEGTGTEQIEGRMTIPTSEIVSLTTASARVAVATTLTAKPQFIEGSDLALYRQYLKMNDNGYSVFVKIEQTADDPNFQIASMAVDAETSVGRFV